MRSALRLICRRCCRCYSYKVTNFPEMPCPPTEPRAPPCSVAQDVPQQQQHFTCCDVRSMARHPCFTPERPKPPKQPKEPFRSVWETSCAITENSNCKDFLPRFDSLYYHPRYDKRRFQRTWVECPPVKQRLKKVCCLDGIEPPEVLPRAPHDRCACNIDYKRLRALCYETELARDPGKKCVKIYQPCCQRLARCKPSCKIRRKTICTKLRAPYPSYSEKFRGRRPLPSSECRCHDFVPKCVAMKVENHRINLEIQPFC
ncbi:uncharacterized protein swif [Drosophila kikkawai]|uniref:Uncharacterized protein swif n=1 Tax=Drosophila kikkawai TaxID=30033 RepID=A0A6P4HML9_DROKI|nr:uncharacterized protein LOC108070847 [Drosophila kikkawai]